MPRRTPPPYYRVSVSGPRETLPYRQSAAEEYNELRVELYVSDRTLEGMLGVSKGSLGRYGRGQTDVPYWVILRLRDLVRAKRADPRSMDERIDRAVERVVQRLDGDLRNQEQESEGRPEPRVCPGLG